MFFKCADQQSDLKQRARILINAYSKFYNLKCSTRCPTGACQNWLRSVRPDVGNSRDNFIPLWHAIWAKIGFPIFVTYIVTCPSIWSLLIWHFQIWPKSGERCCWWIKFYWKINYIFDKNIGNSSRKWSIMYNTCINGKCCVW